MSIQGRAAAATGAAPPSLSIRWSGLLAGGIIVLAALAAYRNSLSCPFIFDDFLAITKNPTIRHLGSAWSPPQNYISAVTSRPVINFSLAVNYALGGLDVRGYHEMNLGIHILAALTLFGIVRRTLLRPAVAGLRRAGPSGPNPGTTPRFAGAATLLAFTVALLWAVHPLQTESVTCMIQRTESLMGLFYLLTLYCFIRGIERRSGFTPDSRLRPSFASTTEDKQSYSGQVSGVNPDLQITRGKGARPSDSQLWFSASFLACLLGMACKEVMVSAPLMVLLYDRTFVAGTFREAWKQRGRWHVRLAYTWLLLGYLLISSGGSRGEAAGFGLGITPWTYALTQCQAIVHYLKLSVCPHPLVLDYGTKVVEHLANVLPQAIMVVLLVLATIFGVCRRPVLGFIGAWFFVILAPSSSVVPLVTQTMAEHRMYLPLAAVITLGVVGLYDLIGQLGVVACFVLALGLTGLTLRRNETYKSDLAIWSDTAVKCPDNSRAHNNLGNALLKMPGQLPNATAQFKEALRLEPFYVDAHYNLAYAFMHTPGRTRDAIIEYRVTLKMQPDYLAAHLNLGDVFLQMPGHLPAAIAEYEAAVRIAPDSLEAHANLGNALLKMPGRLPDAITQLETALRINPDSAQAHYNLGNALLNVPGRLSDATAQFQAAIRIDPKFAGRIR
jgi:Tfp pilus assembly protein PilF